MNLDWSLIILYSEWALRLIMIPVVTHRRKPASAMAWLLIIFFEPIIGFLLFLMIGNNRLPQRRIRTHDRLMAKLESIGNRFRNHPNIVSPEFAPPMSTAVDLAEKLGSMPIIGNNAVELICETVPAIDRLIEDIDNAQHHVHMLFYIYEFDSTGQRVTEALRRACERGVKCRLLVDAVGSSQLIKNHHEDIESAGIEILAALPVKFFRRQAARMDLRNHRKLVVIDGNISYTGSQNIVDASYGHKDLAWHDLMMRINGPVTLELQALFLTDWYFEKNEILDNPELFPEPIPEGNIPIQTLPSGPNYPTENYQRMVLTMIHAAQERVIITTPYFIPDEALLMAIQVAVLRGVEVTVIVPEKSDQIIVGAAAKGYYSVLMEVGAKLYLYTEGLLHSKTVSIDSSISMIGSSNFDIRSFALNFEINMMLYGEEITQELYELQQGYIDISRQLTSEEWDEQRSYSAQIFHDCMRLLSPVL